MNWSDTLETRKTYSRVRLDQVRNGIAGLPALARIENLAIFAAGSYARHEASEHSDLDVFFIYGTKPEHDSRRTLEMELFGSLIPLARQMNFPEFSNDGQYLHTLDCDQMLRHLGSPEDDASNYFTLRMLMLLESECLWGSETYTEIIRRIVNSYYRDYPDHQSSFEPWFLVNDIARFWKTLLLNYENRRNQNRPETNKTKQKVRNFKLKYSRMTICFATIAALGVYTSPVSENDVVELMQRTPQERLLLVAERRPEVAPLIDQILESYAWFLTQTGLPTDALESRFDDKSKRVDMFKQANEYGDLMYSLLERLDQTGNGGTSRMLRFLVI